MGKATQRLNGGHHAIATIPLPRWLRIRHCCAPQLTCSNLLDSLVE